MEIIIHQAILHVLDTTMDAPVLSGSGMEMTAEKTAYFQYHIEKLLASDDIRQCRPLPDSAFKNELEHNRIIMVDMQGVTGTRQQIFVLPYRKVLHFGIQTAGFGDPVQASQLTVCFADAHEAKFGFIGQQELFAVANAISRCIL